MRRTIISTFVASATAFLVMAVMAWADWPNSIWHSVGVCSPIAPANCLQPNSDGSINTSASGSLSAKATAASPSYVEGSSNPLSMDLSGNTRVIVPSSQLITTGTAGAPSAQVLSVQGVSSGTTLPTTDAATGATGSAAPASAQYMGGNGSGATGGLLVGVKTCDQHAFIDSSTALLTVVAGVSGRKTYVCGYILANDGTATNLSLTSGTGTNCGSTSVAITPAYNVLANQSVGFAGAFWTGLVTLAAADNLCVNASAANGHSAEIWYTIQ